MSSPFIGMKEKRLFVTVGTTKFENLIKTISSTDVLTTLQKLGYVEVQFQTGLGRFDKVDFPGMRISYETYFENFDEQIKNADLVVSHAGAGTCLEVLKQQKPLIIVINEALMDNHQAELAEQLQSDGYLYFCVCDNLKETLQKDLNQLVKYSIPNETAFSRYLDKCMGFV